MNKESFLTELKNALSGLPQEEAEECLSFYGEIIDDHVEEGMSEEEAVAGIGPVDSIVAQTVAEIPLARLMKEKIAPKRALQTWEIVLLVLGFPVWFPLLAALGAVLLSLYAVVWALILSLWAVEAALGACVIGCAAAAAVSFAQGYGLQGLAILGAALLCAGLSLFMFRGCGAASKGMLCLTKRAVLRLKARIIKKEEIQ